MSPDSIFVLQLSNLVRTAVGDSVRASKPRLWSYVGQKPSFFSHSLSTLRAPIKGNNPLLLWLSVHHSGLRLLTRCFYSKDDTKLPAAVKCALMFPLHTGPLTLARMSPFGAFEDAAVVCP